MTDPTVFKHWSELAKTAPAQFERERREAIEAFISSSSNQGLLRELQRRADAVRANDPLVSCQQLGRMMSEKFRDLHCGVADLHGELIELSLILAERDVKGTVRGEEGILSLF